MEEWFEKEIIINASTFASFFSYQQTLYSFMSGIIDEVKAEIKDRDAELPVLLSGMFSLLFIAFLLFRLLFVSYFYFYLLFNFNLTLGCSKCKRQHWAEDASRSIKPCTCFKVAYCSQVYALPISLFSFHCVFLLMSLFLFCYSSLSFLFLAHSLIQMPKGALAGTQIRAQEIDYVSN